MKQFFDRPWCLLLCDPEQRVCDTAECDRYREQKTDGVLVSENVVFFVPKETEEPLQNHCDVLLEDLVCSGVVN